MPGISHLVLVLSVVLTLPLPLYAKLAGTFEPPEANCCLAAHARSLADQLEDWNQLGRYHKENLQLRSNPEDPNRIVFFGDSITDWWNLAQFFPGKPYVNRGISGQTTPQMLARFYQDVIRLHPAAVVILAGTNDIARNTGPQTAKMIQDNFRAMAALAKSRDIKVILCSVTPISDYLAPDRSVRRPPSDILLLNDWLKDNALQIDAFYVDYFSAMNDSSGFLKKELSEDGLHPNEKGYVIMAPIVEAAIDRILKQ